MGWYASIYQLSTSSLQMLSGKIYSKFNIKWTYLFWFVIFETGSLICGVSRSSYVFITGRAIAGAGAAGLLNGSLTIAASIVPFERQPRLIGTMVGLSQLGLVLGPLLGGVFTSYPGWRWCFYINLPIGAIVFLGIIFVHIPEHSVKPRALDVLRNLHNELDLFGFALLTPATVMLLLALESGGITHEWGASEVIGLFCGSGACFVLWVCWNYYRGDEALIPFSILKRQAMWSCSIIQWANMSVIFTASYYLPLYFQAIKGTTPSMSGVYVMPSIGSQLVFAVLSGVLGKSRGMRRMFSVSG